MMDVTPATVMQGIYYTLMGVVGWLAIRRVLLRQTDLTLRGIADSVSKVLEKVMVKQELHDSHARRLTALEETVREHATTQEEQARAHAELRTDIMNRFDRQDKRLDRIFDILTSKGRAHD